MKLMRRSLVARISAAMIAISLTALISIGASVFVAYSTKGDAAALNVAGSLRMQTYKIALALHQHHQAPNQASAAVVHEQLESFERRLLGPALSHAIPRATEHDLRQHYLDLQLAWHDELKPHLEQVIELGAEANLAHTQSELEFQVARIETLVTLLEHSTEFKIKLLSLVQMLCLVLMGAAILVALFDIKLNVIEPLKKLVELAKGAAGRDFTHRANMHGEDELSLLGQTFDRMASELSASYANLEAHAAHKTRELERSQRALHLLHRATRTLYDNSGDFCRNTVPLLQQLEELLEIGPVRIHLRDADDQPWQVANTAPVERPEYCRDLNCDACLLNKDLIAVDKLRHPDGRRLLLPIKGASDLHGHRQTLGTLEVWYPQDRILEEPAYRLLETLADQLATAIFIQRRMTEQQHLTLMEERAIIARELHDSLAQSLSYLKIQVARLQRMHEMDMEPSRQDEVLDELRTGLNSAYRQLRELLTTFRLKLDAGGLQRALQRTLDEFNAREDGRKRPDIHLECDLPEQLLSPNEEIHVLQVIRESLTNAVKHAHASRIEVKARYTAPDVQVTITDDGIGLPEGRIPDQHYGLIIMRDRAESLGGNIRVTNRTERGVQVQLRFVPQRARVQALAS